MAVTGPCKAVSALALAVAVSGCGVKQDSIDQQLAAVRQEMEQGDQALGTRIDQSNQRLTGDVASLNDRMRGLEQELQTLRSEFDTRIMELEAAIRFDAPVFFDYDSDVLRQEDMPVLERLAAVVNRYYPTSTLTVEGFADPAGNADYNRGLGMRRAEAVKAFLTTRASLDAARVRTVSYGEDVNRQIEAGKWGEEGLANRRVAFVIDYVAGGPTMAVGSTR